MANTNISAYHDSDHSPVTISIKPEDKQEEDFVTKMRFIIKHAAQKHKDVADKRLFWEMLKMEIRIFAIHFAKKKANAERSTELNLLQNLEKINSRIDETPENISLVRPVARIFTGGCDQLIIRTNERRRRSLLGGPGACPPREILKIKLSETAFRAF